MLRNINAVDNESSNSIEHTLELLQIVVDATQAYTVTIFNDATSSSSFEPALPPRPSAGNMSQTAKPSS